MLQSQRFRLTPPRLMFENASARIDTSSWYGEDDDDGEDLFLKITDY